MHNDDVIDEQSLRRLGEAADWFLQISASGVPDAGNPAWSAWCRDPGNLRELEQLRSVWGEFDAHALEATEHLAKLVAGETAAAPPPRRRWPLRSPRSFMSVCAGILLTCVAGYIAVQSRRHPDQTHEVSAAAQPEVYPALLPDGSTVTLTPRTHMTMDFRGDTRRLELSRGEAYFQVHPDKKKPFIVGTSRVTVTAVGTAFDVRTGVDSVVVTVQEGTVRVSELATDGKSEVGSWRVSAGYQLEYSGAHHEQVVAAVDPAKELSWREGRLQYADESLSNVIADINRYTDRKIEILDPKVAALRFSGTVFTHAIDDWLRALQSSFSLKAETGNTGQVILVDAGESPP